jgi:hypothetical protein
MNLFILAYRIMKEGFKDTMINRNLIRDGKTLLVRNVRNVYSRVISDRLISSQSGIDMTKKRVWRIRESLDSILERLQSSAVDIEEEHSVLNVLSVETLTADEPPVASKKPKTRVNADGTQIARRVSSRLRGSAEQTPEPAFGACTPPIETVKMNDGENQVLESAPEKEFVFSIDKLLN